MTYCETTTNEYRKEKDDYDSSNDENRSNTASCCSIKKEDPSGEKPTFGLRKRVQPLDSDSKEIEYPDGNPNVPRFIVFGRPALGKSELAQRLANVWNCEYVNVAGRSMQETLQQGNDVADIDVIEILMDKLNSPECRENGFVLEDFPTNSQHTLTIDYQLRILESLKPNPNCFILIYTVDTTHKYWCEQKRIDPLTGEQYGLDDTGTYQLIKSSHRFGKKLQNPPECQDESTIAGLLTRVEDVVEFVEKHEQFYEETMKPALETFFRKQHTIPTLRIRTNGTHANLFEQTVQVIYNRSDHPAIRGLDLFGELSYDDAEGDEYEKNLHRSRWQKLKQALSCHSPQLNA